jgi:hypothetical protein
MFQAVFYFLAGVGSGRGLLWLRRISGAAHAFCMLNAAVVVAFSKFMFSRGPLWKIWTTDSTNLTEYNNPLISASSSGAKLRPQVFSQQATEIGSSAQTSRGTLPIPSTRMLKNTPGTRKAS